MARQALNYNLATKAARAKLKPRRKAYYQQIAPRLCLGYYRDRHAWERRERVDGHYRPKILGQADDLAPSDGRDVLTFAEAWRLATNPAASAKVGRLTLCGALDVYLTALASRSKYADDEGAASKNTSRARRSRCSSLTSSEA